MASSEPATSLRAIPATVLHLSQTYQLGTAQKVHTQKRDNLIVSIIGLFCLLTGFIFAYTGIFIYATDYPFLVFGILCAAIGVVLLAAAIAAQDIAYEFSDGLILARGNGLNFARGSGLIHGSGQRAYTVLKWTQLRGAREEEIYHPAGKQVRYFISYATDTDAPETDVKEEALPFPSLWERCFTESRRLSNEYSSFS